ncbi:hypothetical protein PBY51_018724 [Eleginops maclovinus]|uniref:RIIa domain-containing protein n=1 Tax=Eleginops maclovinus TaxID=56733 RepID=A0AAN7YAK8_ELEMC|nr:hypothetical protein PBY51_018724 [Eleginops maclovinus]
MNVQSSCPYGLKSLMECVSRATLLSQPADIPDFLLQYLSELISFRKSHPEDDPKVVSFNFQEMWEKKVLRKTNTPIATIETCVPSQSEVQVALKVLYTDLASSADQKVVKLSKKKLPSATPMHPTPAHPPRAGKKVPPPSLVVEGKGKPAPTPKYVSIKTSRVSKLTVPCQQQSKGKEDDAKKTPGTCRLLPRPTPQKPTPGGKASTSRATSHPSKMAVIPVPVVRRRLVPPPIPEEKTSGGRVSGKDMCEYGYKLKGFDQD